MATGPSVYLCNAWLDAIGNATSFSVSTLYVKLHTGDPGADGTSNAATETTRKSISFGAASSGVITNDTAISWTSIGGSQDASHFSVWDASSGGNFLGSGVITANSYTAGDTYTFAIGAFALSLTPAS